jgi:hypothetical protein
MVKLAVYGKGGIGKSTTVSNVAAALADMGYKVMQIGCDPKADSTSGLHGGGEMPTVLDLVREHKNDFTLDEMVRIGYGGVVCVEAGGPAPGLGCAGRGIIAALEKLKEKGAYKRFSPDVVIYDVLGDVVCGGFSMPMRTFGASAPCISFSRVILRPLPDSASMPRDTAGMTTSATSRASVTVPLSKIYIMRAEIISRMHAILLLSICQLSCSYIL